MEIKKNDEKRKLKELAEDIGVCMMITGFTEETVCAVPMITKKVDSEGVIWFLSQENSRHNKEINANPKTELLYSDPTKMKFLSTAGKSEIVRDKSLVKEFYDKKADTWIKSPDDPHLTIIKFTPEKAHYWDTRANRYEALYHLGISTIIGGGKKQSGGDADIDL